MVTCEATALATDSVTGMVFCGPSSVVAPEAGEGLAGVFALSVGALIALQCALGSPAIRKLAV